MLARCAARAVATPALRTVAVRSYWESIVTPATSEAKREMLMKRHNDLNARRNALGQTPSNVEPINWDEFRSQIKTPGFIDQLKAEYESKKYAEASIPPEMVAFNQRLDKEVEESKNGIQFRQSALEEAEYELDKMKWIEENWENLEYWDAADQIPGAHESLMEEFIVGYDEEGPVEDKWDEMDLSNVPSIIRQGRDPMTVVTDIISWHEADEQIESLIARMEGKAPEPSTPRPVAWWY